jgi:hypothetical protein
MTLTALKVLPVMMLSMTLMNLVRWSHLFSQA